MQLSKTETQLAQGPGSALVFNWRAMLMMTHLEAIHGDLVTHLGRKNHRKPTCTGLCVRVCLFFLQLDRLVRLDLVSCCHANSASHHVYN